MDSMSLWLALAFGQFVALALIKPWFDKKWAEGFLQGTLLVCITVLGGWIYVRHQAHVRMDEMLTQMRQEQIDCPIFPVKK
jgi:hypothetical protein